MYLLYSTVLMYNRHFCRQNLGNRENPKIPMQMAQYCDTVFMSKSASKRQLSKLMVLNSVLEIRNVANVCKYHVRTHLYMFHEQPARKQQRRNSNRKRSLQLAQAKTSVSSSISGAMLQLFGSPVPRSE